jgi:hypothetical protein
MKTWWSGKATFGLSVVFTAFSITACGAVDPASNQVPVKTTPGSQAVTPKSLVYGDSIKGNVVTLHLSPFTDPHLGQSPSTDMPDTRVTVRLPLYPNAVSTSQPYPTADIDYPGSPYLATAKTVYILPADMATSEAWYKKYIESAGYKNNGSGALNNLKTGEHSESLRFAPDAKSDLQIQLSFEKTPDGKTLLEYWITDILTPPRLADTQISSPVERVEVTYKPNAQHPTNQTFSRTITNSEIITSWVKEFNSLPRDTRGAHGGVFNNGHADLTFVMQGGKRVVAHIDPAHFSVTLNDGAGLMMGSLWDRVTAVVDPQGK